ncbi:MAG: four helix bundle protein [Patescibacteria group bacterium]
MRSATSVGANCMEANQASSKRDFKNKIFICRKEIQETKY